MKSPKKLKPRKKLRDTKFGIWLKEHDTELLKLIGDQIPDEKGWRFIKKIVEKLTELSIDKFEGLDLIEAEITKK